MTARPDTHPFNSDQSSALLRRVTKQWDDIVPQLIDYVSCQPVTFVRAEWKRAGRSRRAIDQAEVRGSRWPTCRFSEVITLEGARRCSSSTSGHGRRSHRQDGVAFTVTWTSSPR